MEIMPLEDGAWLDALDARHLRVTYPEWAGAVVTFEDAVKAFRESGFKAFASPAAGLDFDPAYYAEANPEVEMLPGIERYRYWLTEGLARSIPGNAATHLRHIGLGLKEYPEIFPWRHYARLRPAAGAQRWQALEDFVEVGFGRFGERIALDDGAQGFLCALGLHYSGRDDALAVRAYERARQLGRLAPHERQHLADAYFRLECWAAALQVYRALIGAGEGDTWTFRNAIRCCGQLHLPIGLADELAASGLHEAPNWSETVQAAARVWFDGSACRIRTLLADGALAEADRETAAATGRIAMEIERLMPDARPAAMRTDVLFLANLDEPGRATNRVEAKVAMLRALHVPALVVPFNEIERFYDALPHAVAVILFQVPALPDVITGLVQARRMGVPLYFDTDRDLSCPEVALDQDAYHGFMAAEDFASLCFAQSLYRAAARLCDYGLAPTVRMAQAVGRLCRSRQSFVIGDAVSMLFAPLRLPPAAEPAELLLATHAFLYVAAKPGSPGAMLFEVLRMRPQVRLVVSGPVKLGPAFTAIAGQLRREDHRGEALASSNVLISLRGHTAMQEYEALALWEAAGQLALPSVLLLDRDLLPELKHGEQVMRAETAAAWRDALLAVIDAPALAQRVGMAAHAAVAARIEALAEGAALGLALRARASR